MEQRQFTLCQDTQNQEKYLCLNKECYTSKKKQLHCHECLVKLHKTDKNSIKHYEEFVTFDSIINDLIRRNNKKLELYNQMIIDAHQFKKDKFKELCTLKQKQLLIYKLESFSSKSSEFQNQVFKKIEFYVEEVPKQLNVSVSLIRQGLQFQKEKLQFHIEHYTYRMIQNLKIPQNQHLKRSRGILKLIYLRQNYRILKQLSKKCDSEYRKKTIQQLQKKITDLEGVKTMPKIDYFPKKITIIIIIPVLYLIYTIQQLDNQLFKLQMKLDQQSLSIIELQKLLIQEVKQLKKEQDNQIDTLIISHDSLQSNNDLKDIIINNDSKLALKVIQLQKKTDEEFNKTKNILQEFVQNNSYKLNLETKTNVEYMSFNEQSEILKTDYIINHLIIEQQRQKDRSFQLQLNFTKAELIYKSKRDGLSMNAFWQNMRQHGSTLLIAKFHNLQIVGALTIPPYIPLLYGDYMVDVVKKSFLFSYTKKQIYKLKEYNFTLYSKHMVGPQFGQGPDLSLQGQTFDQCSSNIGYTYEYGQEKGESIMNGSPLIIEMEVFLLS